MQRIKNYGSFLQAYALKKIVESFGYDVEFVDYHVCDSIITSKKKGYLKKIVDILLGNANFCHKIKYILYKKNFSRNFKLLKLSEKPNYNPVLDTLIIGSDEVFNVIQSNDNVGYSLELFGKNNKASKVITYAASFGNTTIDKINQYGKEIEISSLLQNIDSISVRDKNSCDIVSKLTNKRIIINLDPVLIFDYMNSDLLPDISIKEKYMILYAYDNRISKFEAKVIRKFAQKNGLKIYSIGGSQPYVDKFIDCSPFEVLSYFKQAEFVVTDTFHGSIFSIINEKKFATIVRPSYGNYYGNEEKIYDLLNKLYLRDRIIYDISMVDDILNKKIDYKIVKEIINKEKDKAMDYLNKNI